ncbi:MAG: hypothetical protein U5L72_12460 [Bacteroidales bacterium]|nr:hypothetical protein [Bacteroidales bacterium]
MIDKNTDIPTQKPYLYPLQGKEIESGFCCEHISIGGGFWLLPEHDNGVSRKMIILAQDKIIGRSGC